MKRISATALVTAWPIRSSRLSCSTRVCVGAEHEAEQAAGVDQADQHDIARIGDLVRQQQMAQPRPHFTLFAVVDNRIAAGVEYPQKPAIFLAQNAFGDESL